MVQFPLTRCRAALLLVAVGGGHELKDLVRGQRSVGQLFGRCIDSVASVQADCYFCNQRNWDTRRYRNRLRAVLIANHQSAATAFLYRAVRHAGVRRGRSGDGAVRHSVVGACAWRVEQNTAFRRPAQLAGKDDDLLREFCSVRLLYGCYADIGGGGHVTHIRRYLLIGCEGLRDRNVDDPLWCRNIERTAVKRLDLSQNTGKRRRWLCLPPDDVCSYRGGQQRDDCEVQQRMFFEVHISSPFQMNSDTGRRLGASPLSVSGRLA